MKSTLTSIALAVAMALAILVAPWTPASADPTVPPQGPSLEVGQCYTFPQIPGHVISTICRLK